LVLINNYWTWTTITSKVANFVNYYVKDSLYKGTLMKKDLDDVNWLSTLKKHSKFENYKISKILKLKFNELKKKIQKSLPHVNGV
jgi:hypothetical protein